MIGQLLDPANDVIAVLANFKANEPLTTDAFDVADNIRIWRIRWCASQDAYPLLHLNTSTGRSEASLGGRSKSSGTRTFYAPGRFVLECNINGPYEIQAEAIQLVDERNDRPALNVAQAKLFQFAVENKGEGAITITLPGGLQAQAPGTTEVVIRPLDFHELIDTIFTGNPIRFEMDLAIKAVESIGGRPPSYELLRSLLVGDLDAILFGIRRATLGPDLPLLMSCTCGQVISFRYDFRNYRKHRIRRRRIHHRPFRPTDPKGVGKSVGR